MMQFPNIDPIAFHIGPLKVYWYGLMYVLGFLSAWMLGRSRARQNPDIWSNDAVGDLIFYCALGVILGGRVGYILFYQFSNFLAEPFIIFKIWQGGMSFHGGLIGVIAAGILYCKRYAKSFLTVMDFVAPLVPIGLGAGRIGNFINGELWGRETTMPWGVIFPVSGPLPRHPSEIYEFLLEGVLLFLILWIFSSKRRPVGAVSALFLVGYGIFRFIAECFRQPDAYLGFIAFDWMTMGQVLSVPMIIGGIFLMSYSYWKLLRMKKETKNKELTKRRAAKWKAI